MKEPVRKGLENLGLSLLESSYERLLPKSDRYDSSGS